MSFKVAFIGAGSLTFCRTMLKDLLAVPEFRSIELAFMDIDRLNLDISVQLCQRDIDANGLDIKIHSTVDRREAVAGAKYVLNLARVGGLEAFATDVEIPLRYGVDQCVGDTLCAGGVMYGQRGVAFILGLCEDIKALSRPDCLLLNYGNPNAMLTWAANHHGQVRCLGLCHGVQGGHQQIATVLGLAPEDIDIICAGINHQTWYIQVRHHGQDMTGKLLEAFERHPDYSKTEKVRIDMLRRFGYYSTESNGHLSEYVPWYRKRGDEIKNWIDLGCWIHGETGGYLRVCTEGRDWIKHDYPAQLKAEPKRFDMATRSHEHGSRIIESLETGRVYRGHFNVPNRGAISNLPDDAIVEVPGYVDGNGVNIPRVGDLPLGCAAVCNVSVSVQRLAVEAAVRGDDQLLRQAMMMDPLTGAVCDPPEIWQMVDELLVAQERWLPQYAVAVAAAKARLVNGLGIPVREGYSGAARLKTKTIEELAIDKRKAQEAAAQK